MRLILKSLILVFAFFIILSTYLDAWPEDIQKASNGNLWLAIVDKDYVLLPIAVFTAGKWKNEWTTPGTCNIKQPPSVKTPGVFNFYGVKYPLKSLTVTQKKLVSTHCDGNWALLTDLSPKEVKTSPEKFLGDFIGVAANKPLTVFEERSVQLDLEKAKPIVKAIIIRLNQLESKEFKKMLSLKGTESNKIKGTFFPINEKDRLIVEPKIELFSIQALSPSVEAYRFKVDKFYYGEDKKCPNITAYSGWVIPKVKGENVIVDIEFKTDFCDGSERSTLSSLGFFQHENSLLGVYCRYYYEWEYYEIYRFKNGTIEKIIDVPGGGC